MATANVTRRSARRAENFRVRRWLQVGAASAGVGAALMGLSPLGPQVGVARADEPGQSSTSAGSDAGGPAGGAVSSTAGDDAKDVDSKQSSTLSASVADAQDPVGSNSPAGSTEEADAKLTAAKVTADEVVVHAAEAVALPNVKTSTTAEETHVSPSAGSKGDPAADLDPSASTEPSAVAEAAKTTGVVVASRTSTGATAPTAEAPTASVVAQSDPIITAPVIAAAAPAQPWVVQTVGSRDVWQQAIDGLISTLTSTTQSAIGWLPIPDEFKQLVMGALWTTRRAFFNQAPVVTPVQLISQSNGPIEGRVDAVDPEGDPIVYRLASGPRSGTVQVDPDGSFTYTPGSDFNGFDSFAVTAQDVGVHVNLLDPFRAAGASVGVLVNQGAITFLFNYTTGSQYWSADARNALQSAANSLARYLVVTSPVILTYDVGAEDSTASGILASAGSGLIGSGAGFFRTVVQNKLITGVDANGAVADGQINWNFGYAWGLGDSVAAGEYDFTSIAMHEVMHSLGFLSNVGEAGSNTGLGWSVFDSFLETAGGTRVIGPGYSWNPAFDPDLTGANGGLYFGGANAVSGYGSLVPVYTPNPWVAGSSMSHLDDATFTGSNQQLMNARADVGQRVRGLSPAELGILADLGYTVAPQSPANALALFGVIFLRIPRRKSPARTS